MSYHIEVHWRTYRDTIEQGWATVHNNDFEDYIFYGIDGYERAVEQAKLFNLMTEAAISDCGMYRYWLSRRLSMGERTVLFVGLNPSTADALQDDPTIRRCSVETKTAHPSTRSIYQRRQR